MKTIMKTQIFETKFKVDRCETVKIWKKNGLKLPPCKLGLKSTGRGGGCASVCLHRS